MTTSPDSAAPLLQMQAIEKSFFGVRVLKGVDFDLYAGEVHALLGENGAGKSTLIKILNGDYRRDGGTLLLDGAPAAIDSPRAAERHGIRMIYQELHYAPELSVTENLLLGHLPSRRGPLGRQFVDWQAAHRLAEHSLGMLDVAIDPRLPMRKLSTVEREIVEIAKALTAQARILVMDEPTAALTPHEVDRLFGIVHSLRTQGVAIIYISHRLDEIFQIAQRATVLRDGALVGTRRVADLHKQELVRMMVGRDIGEGWARTAPTPTALPGASPGVARPKGRPMLEVEGLAQPRAFHDISLAVHAGEIVGVFGLLGAGHVHLTRAIYGAEPLAAGTIRVDGQPVTVRSPRDGRRCGIGLVPVDRKVQGLVLDRSVKENITLSNWGPLTTGGFFKQGQEKTHVAGWIDRLGIRMAGGMDVRTRLLSGGNQQKVVLARWMEAGVKVLLLNEPTWGVDIGARFDIYEQLEALAREGLAILMVSSDIQEVLAVSHRILTIYRGRLTAEFTQEEATQEKLLHAASGELSLLPTVQDGAAGGQEVSHV
jgi:ribose transport system ATP-binding protein